MKIYCFVDYFLPKEYINSIYNFEAHNFDSYNFESYKFDSYNFESYNFETDIVQLYYNDNDTIDYINKISDNHALVNKIETMDEKNKELFIKLLILYFTGGIIINNKINITNIESIKKLHETNDLLVVKSCMFNNIFDGLIMSGKENNIIFNSLNQFLENDTKDKSLNNILFNNISSCNDNKCKILNEKIINNKSDIYYDETIIAEHHFSKSSILELFEIKKNPRPPDLSKLKIGITIDIPENLKSFYSNGIRQNSLYFYELLKNINHDVKLIINNNKHKNVIEEIDFYKYEYIKLNGILNEDFDLIFSFGFSLTKSLFHILKKKGVKIVAYMCGNSYLIDSERILYNQHSARTIDYSYDESMTFDQMWSIPQMYKQNKYYWETLYRTKCIQVPFIWSPNSIEFIKKISNLEDESSLQYKRKEGKIAILEPNLSLMKWSLPCLLISEMTHRNYKNISHVYITNIEKEKKMEDMKNNTFNLSELNNMCKNLDLFKNKKLSIEGRYVTLDFMSKFADVVVSHQWENPLNYLYFDLAWMGWPILHNAHLCKDVGYYYDQFDYHDASEKLNTILLHHETNKVEYLKQNRKVIENYIPTNSELQKKYKNLIENLFTN